MPSFNLIHEQWIPCLMAAGPPRDRSLRDVLLEAHDIRAIAAPSPLATAAIHRLLLAILYRAGAASDDDGWGDAWASKDIRAPQTIAYLNEWGGRFDLFDPAHPFYQVAGLGAEYAGTAAKLSHELNAGNNAALFDHSLDDVPDALTPGEAARALLALQAFAPGGLITFEKGRIKDDKSADAAPLVKAGLVLVAGNNLAETLLLNLFRVDAEAAVPFSFLEGKDRPAWESDEPTRALDRELAGPLDLLTWQSRRVLLFPEERDGSAVVSRAAIMKGHQFPTGFRLGDHEPMVSFRQVLQAKPDQEPMPPIGFRPERALWRDSLSLLTSSDPDLATNRGGRQRPRTIEALARREFGESVPALRVSVLGLGADRAKLLLWRHEELPLPLAYLDGQNTNLQVALGRCMELAEEGGRVLRQSTWKLAADVLSPAGSPDRKRVDALVDALAPERPYWSALDAPFRRLMVELAATYAADEGRVARSAWRDSVAAAARRAFDAAAESIETNARGLRAAAEARGMFAAFLARELNQFGPMEVPV